MTEFARATGVEEVKQGIPGHQREGLTWILQLNSGQSNVKLHPVRRKTDTAPRGRRVMGRWHRPRTREGKEQKIQLGTNLWV